jgi:hypothetical protein
MAHDIPVTKKPWGKIETLHRSDNFILQRLIIREGGVSTFGEFHFHNFMYNKFFIELGRLKVYKKGSVDENIEIHILGPEEKYRLFDIFPKIYHRFEALEDCIVYELYYSTCSEKDIVRLKG